MEYPKIETLFERDEKTHKVIPDKLRHPVFGLLKVWDFTEKIDGTNVRIIWHPAKDIADKGGPSLSFYGRTDNAQMPADLVKNLYELVSVEKLQAVFPAVDAVVYGEGYGAGIQKGGSYSPTKKFAAFDVLVDGKWWLDWTNVCDVAAKLGIETVPFVGEWPLEKAIEFVRVGFESKVQGAMGADCRGEGLVGRPKETLFDKKGSRVIIKLKTRDF